VGDIASLKDKQRALREKLAAMGTVSDEGWPSLRDSVETTYHDVRAQYGALAHREPETPASADSLSGFLPAQPH
jgi:hypothetical protein